MLSDRFIASVYVSTGLRPSELRLSEIGDMDTESWTLYVRHPKGEESYGRKRTVPILPFGREAVVRFLRKREEYLASAGKPYAKPLIPTVKNGAATFYSAQTLNRVKARIERVSGVSFKMKHFRSTFGQKCIDMDASKTPEVSRVMGHGSTRTTEKYYARVKEEAAVQGLNRLFEGEDGQKPLAKQPRIKPLIETREYMSGYA